MTAEEKLAALIEQRQKCDLALADLLDSVAELIEELPPEAAAELREIAGELRR